ncbi:MAG: tetratricopeptide repeat protein [Candidatus Ozemobacteraceae bacterium]
MQNYYQMFGVPHFASLEEIAAAYKKIYNELFSSESPLSNIPKLKEIKEALEMLSDDARRTAYDAELRVFLAELEKSYERAVDALSAGNFDEVTRIIKECIKINPREPDFYETLGVAYQLMNNVEEAIRVFQQGLRLGTRNAQFNWYLADAFRSLRDDDRADTHSLDAVEGFKEILKVDPKNTQAQELLADTFSKMKWYEEALDVYAKLIEQFPYKADYHREMGGVLYELDLLDEAEEHLQEALQNAPDDPSALLYLGLLYFKKRLLGKAIITLEASLAARPDQPETIKLIEKIGEIREDVGRTIEEIIHEPCPDAMVEGTVKWYNIETGIGVLQCPEYPEVLLHYSALPGAVRDTLHKGDHVRFGVVKDKVGPVAVQVEPLGESSDSDTFPGKIIRFDTIRRIGMIEIHPERHVMFSFTALAPGIEEHLISGLEVLFEVKTSRGLEDKAIEQAANIRIRKKPAPKGKPPVAPSGTSPKPVPAPSAPDAPETPEPAE